nr:MAG TPA: hypothetical protein [Caudoviricetes sp.]
MVIVIKIAKNGNKKNEQGSSNFNCKLTRHFTLATQAIRT